MSEVSTLSQFLTWLATGGGALILVTWIVSWSLETVDFWKNLDSNLKKGIIAVFAAVIAVLSLLLQTRPDIIAAVEPFAKPFVMLLMFWLSTQLAHKVNPLRNKAEG